MASVVRSVRIEGGAFPPQALDVYTEKLLSRQPTQILSNMIAQSASLTVEAEMKGKSVQKWRN